MAKDLKSILAGVKSSKIAPPPIDDKNMYQWNGKDGVAFIKKHNIETHADRAGNGDDVYKGTTKEAPYKKAKVAEEVENIDEISKRKVIKYLNTLSAKEIAAREEGKKSQSFPDAIDGTKKPSTYNKKRAVGRGLASDKLIGDARVNATEEVDLDEGNKENKAKKKAVMADKPKEKEKEFDPREFFSAARRGRQMEENFDGMKSLKSQIGLRSPKALAAFVKNKKDKKLGEGAGCNHTMEGVMCEVHGESACPTKENDVNTQKPKKKDSKGREYLADKKKCMEEVQYIEEKLTAKDPVSKWIHDFVHSDNPKFTGKSTKERQKMALGAYYDKKRGVKESGSATNTDYAGPGAAGWTTGRHDMGTL